MLPDMGPVPTFCSTSEFTGGSPKSTNNLKLWYVLFRISITLLLAHQLRSRADLGSMRLIASERAMATRLLAAR